MPRHHALAGFCWQSFSFQHPTGTFGAQADLAMGTAEEMAGGKGCPLRTSLVIPCDRHQFAECLSVPVQDCGSHHGFVAL